jgi:hypothetical protein
MLIFLLRLVPKFFLSFHISLGKDGLIHLYTLSTVHFLFSAHNFQKEVDQFYSEAWLFLALPKFIGEKAS